MILDYFNAEDMEGLTDKQERLLKGCDTQTGQYIISEGLLADLAAVPEIIDRIEAYDSIISMKDFHSIVKQAALAAGYKKDQLHKYS